MNKTIRQINIQQTFDATITRIGRSGIDSSPTPESRLQFCDKLIIATSKTNMEFVVKFFGNEDKNLYDTDILPNAIGIFTGVLIGKINLTFGSFTFTPGLTGGVL